MNWIFDKIYSSRIHCFNYFINNTKCIDMELSYFVKCSTKIVRSYQSSNNLPCHIASEAEKNLTEKHVLLLSTKHELNIPMTASFTGNWIDFLNCVNYFIGQITNQIHFTIDDGITIFNACSFTLKNELWIAGGSWPTKRQV